MTNRPSLSIHNLILESESANDESWMTSYIDVFVLMTGIFVVLFMMSKPDSAGVDNTNVINNVSDDVLINLSDDTLLDLVQPRYSWAEKIKNKNQPIPFFYRNI